MADLDRIRDLTFKIDLEASICSQYRLNDLQEEQANTQQMLGQVLRQQEKLPQDVMNHIESYVVNSMLSHLSSSPYVDQGLLGGMLPLFRAEQSYDNAHSKNGETSITRISELSHIH